METNNQDKALAMELARILKPTAFELIKAIGDNKVLICIQPHGGIAAKINGKDYLVGWHNVNEESQTIALKELSDEELKHIEEIIGDGYKVYGRDDKRQSLLFDGELYISDIIEAADYIRSITQKE